MLSVKLHNKIDSDVKKDRYDDPDNFTIIGDMLLNIESVEIDEINLDSLFYTESKYLVDQPVVIDGQTTSTVKKCVNLGWNGEWQLTWNNPFYIWLLENI